MGDFNSLLVRGSSRLLNKLYCKDIEADGTLSVSGGLSVSGRSTMNDGINVGYTNTKYLLSCSSFICQSWVRTVGNAGWYNETYAGGWYMTDSTYIRNYNNKALLLSGNLYMGSTTYYFNTSGILNASTVTTNGANIGTLNCTTKAEFMDVNVKNSLRSVKWEINNVANLGGTFYVAPTLYFSANTTVIVNDISGTSVTLTITDATTISSSVAAGVTWYANSKIKLSGKIGNCVLGTADGTLSATMHSTANTLKCIVNIEEASKLTAGTTYSGANVSELCVMMYSLYSNVSGTSAARPVGIAMTSYGQNKSSAIDIYGGTSDTPNVRIGLLTGISDSTLNPSGWGIYASNGYFKGKIVATSGKIGDFNISTRLYTNNNDFNNSVSDSNVYIGENGISLGKGQFKVTDAGALTATSANITGTITTTSGQIGGFTINSNYLANNTSALAEAENSVYLGTNGISCGKNFQVSNTGALSASGVNINGNVVATSISANTTYKIYNGSYTYPILEAKPHATNSALWELNLCPNLDNKESYIQITNTVRAGDAAGLTGVSLFGRAITLGDSTTDIYIGGRIVSSTLKISGAATIEKTLKVTGSTTLSSSLGVTGAVTCNSSLSVKTTSTLTGAVTAKSTVTISGVTKINNQLHVSHIEITGEEYAYIDFHHNKSTADFTSRIITSGAGKLLLGGGGTYGFIMIDSPGGFIRPEVNANFSLGSNGIRFDSCWLKGSVNQGSLAEWKTNITPFDSALTEINKTDVYNYQLIHTLEKKGSDVTRTGFVIGDGYNLSSYLINEEKNSIDLYSAIGVTFAGVKELHELVKKQQETIQKLNEKLERLEAEIT